MSLAPLAKERRNKLEAEEWRIQPQKLPVEPTEANHDDIDCTDPENKHALLDRSKAQTALLPLR